MLIRLLLYQLLHEAYRTGPAANEDDVVFEDWRVKMEEKSSQFQFWSITLKMELDYLLFLRSIRSGNFELYKFSIRQLLPWMFTLDRYNYAHWLSIHLCDMENLHETDPCVYDEFSKYGNFVISRTKTPFQQWG